jgi:eukaryotic-like serine/threonine-protein kinase
LRSVLTEFAELEVIGTGAGSTIFKGRSLKDGRIYAIKVVKWTTKGDERYLKQALNEYRIASLFSHDSIVKMYRCVRVRRFLKTVECDIVMEYVPGRMLHDKADLPMADIIGVFLQVASAVAYIHKLGFVHTDIKPENILVDANANATVIDFGVACKRSETKDRVQGTPEFMAPEQLSKKPLDERTDIYNLGATMYKILTGKVVPENISIVTPMGGANGSMSLAKVGVRGLNARVPETFAHIVEKCSRRSRSKRYQRMSEVVDALATALREVAPPGHRLLEKASA